MSKISFAKQNSETASTPVVEAAAPQSSVPAVVQRPSVPQRGALSFADDDGGFDLSQIQIPRLNIVQGVGELSATHTPGEILLHRQLVLPQPVEIVFVAFRPDQYSEKMEGNVQGRLFNTRAEVADCGGTLDYNVAKANKEVPLFQAMATAAVLIRQHSNIKDGSHFTHEIDGARYSFALWTMKGAAYTRGAKVVRTARALGVGLDLRKGYATGAYGLETKKEVFATKNVAFVPVLKPIGPTSQALQDYARDLLSALAGNPEVPQS